jgi:hypothetical protein
MGIVVNDGYYYTAQLIDENRVILHNIEKDDMPRISSIVGRNVEIKCLDGRIEAIAEEPERYESSRGWNR